MHKALKIISLLLISLSFSSCIEIVEEIKINQDLSGNYHLYLEHKDLDFLFNSMAQDFDLRELETILKKLKQQDGISNFSADIRPNKGKVSIQFDFSDSKSLTKAFYASIGAEKRFYNKSFLKVKQAKIKRPNLTPYFAKYAKTKGWIDKISNEKIYEYIKYHYRVICSNNIKSAVPPSHENSINLLEYNQLYPIKSLLVKKQSIRSVIRLQENN